MSEDNEMWTPENLKDAQDRAWAEELRLSQEASQARKQYGYGSRQYLAAKQLSLAAYHFARRLDWVGQEYKELLELEARDPK